MKKDFYFSKNKRFVSLDTELGLLRWNCQKLDSEIRDLIWRCNSLESDLCESKGRVKSLSKAQFWLSLVLVLTLLGLFVMFFCFVDKTPLYVS